MRVSSPPFKYPCFFGTDVDSQENLIACQFDTVEEIANKIGAKSQLVRTGALYHDIGKMLNPAYYTENQSGINPHASLTEVESASMIISHVTEGQKMAERYNLPSVIRDFISTHHGQGKTKYFYIKYKNEHPDEDIDELLFTYPGPNPFTREQAILMMADSVEATSRSLKDYTETTIRNMVDSLIDGMVADGFFRECPITFREARIPPEEPHAEPEPCPCELCQIH